MWLTINLIFLASSYLSHKNFVVILFGLTYLLNWVIGLYILGYALYILWQIITQGQWLLLILAFFFGSFIIGFWTMIYELLLAPFNGIVAYFVEVAEKFTIGRREEHEAEFISPEGEIIHKVRSDDSERKRLSKWFLVGYGAILLWNIVDRQNRYGWKFGDFITMPLITLVILTLPCLLIVFIYFKVRKKKIASKKSLLASSLKLFSILYLILLVLQLLYSL